MRDDPTVISLVVRARTGDRAAWDEIVERYAPLVWSICRRYHVAGFDADDVGQSVWLRLVEQLPVLREPAALPGWLVTTTRRECMQAVRRMREREQRENPAHGDDIQSDGGSSLVEEDLLEEELGVALREGFAQLSPRCRRLLAMLVHDPPASYEQISATLEMPVGGIGPSRARCLEKLRHTPALAALVEPARNPAEWR